MEQHHRKLINNNLEELMSVTNDLESIVDNLLKNDVINDWMKENILNSPDYRNRNVKLYNIIQGRGPKAFVSLCKALEDTLNIRALKILLQKSYSNNDVNPDLDNGLISRINLNNSKCDEPYIKVHPNRQRMDVNDEKLPTGAYPMGSNPKGHVLILNMNKVKGHGDRLGSDVDVASLQKLFNGLGFVVQSSFDLNKKKFEDVIQQFIKNCRNEKSNSIVVFIMSHGEAGYDSSRSSDILTADGNTINTDWIIEQFGLEKMFQYKPKLFFIQGCRGENTDLGWSPSNNKNNRLQNDSTDINIDKSSTDNTDNDFSNRRYENVFIAHATIPGYKAKRDTIDGSWFVQNICKVISENAWKHDLNTMMKMVDKEISKLNSSCHGSQTVEWTYRGFNKMFFFNPGLYDNDAHHGASKTTSSNPTDT